MQALIQRAVDADVQLFQMNQQQKSSDDNDTEDVYYLPSLSILTEAVFGRLTGVSAANVRKWADALVLAYATVDGSHHCTNVVQWCREVLSEKELPPTTARNRPCGYVFKRGDIAWNCRTCQADNTCVICDECFRHSDHEGHEVFFHRTQPGGCCDCGDIEAWDQQGCCPQHTPAKTCIPVTTMEDEAVKSSQVALEEGQGVVRSCLGQSMAGSALGIVIGMAVQTIVEAMDGAGIGCDVIQWTKRWSDEIRKIHDKAPYDEDYFSTEQQPAAESLASAKNLPLPQNYKLHLRLHNDDVHTFDEVIDALHPRNSSASGAGSGSPLVPSMDLAEELTHYVDSDGQVTVKSSFTNLQEALEGFTQLRLRGLQCVVASTPQVDLELRARMLVGWLSDLCQQHASLQALVIHAFLDVSEGSSPYGGIPVWTRAHMIPPWSSRHSAFPTHLSTSFLTREESFRLYTLGLTNPHQPTKNEFLYNTGACPNFYARVPYRLPSERYRKSPHALWGTSPSVVSPNQDCHPILDPTSEKHSLTEPLLVLDTDLRKQQEAETLTTCLYPHSLLGLHLVSGIGLVPDGSSSTTVTTPNLQEWRHLLSTSSFRAPISPLLILLLLDPYPPKAMRSSLHSLFLTLLKDGRFKSRFAASLLIAYRPLTTLFCSGIGTEGDTPLSFTVQIFTAKSLVSALSNSTSMKQLLSNDLVSSPISSGNNKMEDVFTIPIAHTVVRCIHTNLLGATKEVKMVLKHTSTERYNNTELIYQMGEGPLHTVLPAAPDDKFLDSRSAKFKRLPHLYRDLEYILDTPGTSSTLLQDATFVPAFCRLLRLAQGMDTQKRKINGAHVEYEQSRWLEAFGLSLTITSTRDALFQNKDDSMTHLWMCLWRELKWWLYQEGLLNTGIYPVEGGPHPGNLESLQRSTLHVGRSIALSCAVGVKMTEPQLLQMEASLMKKDQTNPLDWLKVPHSPLSGDTLSFHLPLHRTLARSILTLCQLPSSSGFPPNLDPENWIVSAMRTGNCRVMWSGGIECTSEDAQMRRQRSRALSTKIAHFKILHSICDHPLRCLVAATQMERHLWVRNGSGVAGMALNYSCRPTCHSFRDLDLTCVQLSAAGGPMGLGASRVFSLLLSRFTMDGYLCNPERKGDRWVHPPRLVVDPDHATTLAESFFMTLCILVTELPSPPPTSDQDDRFIKATIKRELIHALAAEPRSYSEALSSTTLTPKRGDSRTFSSILAQVSSLKKLNKSNVYVLKPEYAPEYDPTFYHLRRPEHQHAMETIATLRSSQKKCWPLVAPPPPAHSMFVSCRLLLHLTAMDAALRRMLLFGLTNGKWVPPAPLGEQQQPQQQQENPKPKRGRSPKSTSTPQLSPQVVAESSVSLMDVLQLLTLQIHTLEECASLHSLPHVDGESAFLSQQMSINSFLQRWIHVPSSLVHDWSLESLPTNGNGLYRGSILGLLIALFEHRGTTTGAKTLAADGLKWLLRFVHSLVHSAPSIKVAHECATNGTPYVSTNKNNNSWSMELGLQQEIQGMLNQLSDLWPQRKEVLLEQTTSPKSNKDAQRRALARMKAQQASFALSISSEVLDEGECIICKCDNPNDTLGYLGHVQRSRVTSLNSSTPNQYYRVVGEKGCQLRERSDMESPEVARLPRGSIVELCSTSSGTKSVKARRVLVQTVFGELKGWANICSRQGYVILSPLAPLCEVGRWGSTRPILKTCGHAAHFSCVETHCLSLHQRNASDQPYDGRFAANIDDGEFLCPLCKQLSNVLVPTTCTIAPINTITKEEGSNVQQLQLVLKQPSPNKSNSSSSESKASRRYGAHLLQSMQAHQIIKKKKRKWHPTLYKWDAHIKLDYLRQLHIAFATLGHSASTNASTFTKTLEDPWMDYDGLCRDSHPSLLEMRSILHATTSLLQVLLEELQLDMGSLLSNILSGNFWSKSGCPTSVWSSATALLAATPCHVARDGMLDAKHMARCTATAMWIMNTNSEKADHVPPTPLAILPFDNDNSLASIGTDSEIVREVLASAYLYVPILAWDLTNLAGAIFPFLIMKQGSPQHIMTAAQLLLTARLIQSLVTPNGLTLITKEDDEEAPSKEQESLQQLQQMCRTELQMSSHEISSPVILWKAASNAILPFARTLLLLLRASMSSLRQQKKEIPSKIDALLVDTDDAFYTDDGWEVWSAMEAPMPSTLLSQPEYNNILLNWLKAVFTLESYHGSQGNGLIYDSRTQQWIPHKYTNNPPPTTGEAVVSNQSMDMEDVEEEPADMEEEEEEDIDLPQEEVQAAAAVAALLNNQNTMEDYIVGESEEEDEEEDEEMEHVDSIFVLDPRHLALQEASEMSSSEESAPKGRRMQHKLFAHVNKSPMIPHQPSFLGIKPVGPGSRGFTFDSSSIQLYDVSHLGNVTGTSASGFISLPHSFVELYALVNQIKGHYDNEETNHSTSETAICLLTGKVIQSGSTRNAYSRAHRKPGACTLHARECGSGIGIFFLLQKCTVLLLHNNKSAYSASLYVDDHGEEDPGLRRGRPLFLQRERYQLLQDLWYQHKIPREVAQIRSTSDRVIRDDWY